MESVTALLKAKYDCEENEEEKISKIFGFRWLFINLFIIIIKKLKKLSFQGN